MKPYWIIITSIVLISTGCKEWEEHYETPPPTIDRNVWEAIKEDPELSTFVGYVEEFQYDTLFDKQATYTLFVPTNKAFEEYTSIDTVNQSVLNYHISKHFINSVGSNEATKIQMLAEKFVSFENLKSATLFDGIPLEFESPLYRNGKYYIMNKVAVPKPNLFEYYAESNRIFRDYILELDSIIVDKEKSRPIGFDDNGNTIYDTVAIIYNEFEENFFPIREEFRFKTATMVFPNFEDYNLALDKMAEELGSIYQDHTDIPIEWQKELLIPYLLEQGTFENSLSYSDFIKTSAPNDTLKLKNILGDSIAIEYEVAERFESSNGIAFNYKDFTIPDTLYKGAIRIEMENFVKETGINKFAWKTQIAKATSTTYFAPMADWIPSASNDSIVRVVFDKGYEGDYTLELKIDNLFPRKYLMVVRTSKNYGGVFDVYLNDIFLRTMDYSDYLKSIYQYYYPSVTGKKYFVEDQGYHYWDVFAQNNREYGKATLRFEYMGPGEKVFANAILIDYIDFIPYDE